MTPPVSVSPCNTYHPDEVRRALDRCLELLEVDLPRGASVLVKPNALAANRPDQATATHHALVDAVCARLADCGNTLTIGDSSAYWFPGYTRRSFETLGLTEVAARYGARLVCFEEEPPESSPRPEDPDADTLWLADLGAWDLVVNLPKLKVHRVTRISGAVKNLFGLVPGGTKQRYHEALKHRPGYLDRLAALLVDVYLRVRPGLSILDGVVGLERDGPAATGDPRRTRFLLASEDALALDVALCRLIGEEPAAVPTLRDALRRGLVDPDAVRLVGDPPRVDFVLLQAAGRKNPLARAAMDLVLSHLVVRPTIDPARCRGSHECVARCPVGAIRPEGRVRIDHDRCISCYGCPAWCEAGALTLEGSRLFSALQVARRIKGV